VSRVVVLTGGVGGAKLVLGLMQVMPAEQITAIVNTGDDFRHLGLWICPDLDTLLYTLAGNADPERGWGREAETWNFMSALKSLAGEDWFLLGDGDLALHVLRTSRLDAGLTLCSVTAEFARSWGVKVTMLPMSDDSVATHLTTDEGDLPFQRYFVERRCAPAVRAVRFEGANSATAAHGVREAILSADTEAVLIAPSNPYLSIDPILAVSGIRQALEETSAPVVAVSPLVGGQAVKGPTAKLMREMGIAVTPASIADHYRGIIDGLLVDERDACGDVGVTTGAADTLMVSLQDRARVAVAALTLAKRL
jgi:LPPG:FO 2-phospho-L-lactate transferase